MTKAEELWREFRDKVISKDASEQQLAEMRMGFVSGLLVGATQFQNPLDAVDLIEEAEVYATQKSLTVYKKTQKEL